MGASAATGAYAGDLWEGLHMVVAVIVRSRLTLAFEEVDQKVGF